MPAPRERTAWENLIKCVDGENCMMNCIGSGMLSNGVIPPDKIFITRTTGMASRPNCGILRAMRYQLAILLVFVENYVAGLHVPANLEVFSCGMKIADTLYMVSFTGFNDFATFYCQIAIHG